MRQQQSHQELHATDTRQGRRLGQLAYGNNEPIARNQSMRYCVLSAAGTPVQMKPGYTSNALQCGCRSPKVGVIAKALA